VHKCDWQCESGPRVAYTAMENGCGNGVGHAGSVFGPEGLDR
jgi:hypothetical protein